MQYTKTDSRYGTEKLNGTKTKMQYAKTVTSKKILDMAQKNKNKTALKQKSTNIHKYKQPQNKNALKQQRTK